MVVLVAADVFGLFDTINDLSFVIKLIAFAYLTFYLYITFAENMPLFGLSEIVLGYLLMFHAPVIVSLGLIVLFVMFGGMLQMNLQMGLEQAVRGGQQIQEMERQEAFQRKVQSGAALNAQEQQMYAEMQAQQQMQQGYQNSMLQIRSGGNFGGY